VAGKTTPRIPVLTPRRFALLVAIAIACLAVASLALRPPAARQVAFFGTGQGTLAIDGGTELALDLIEPGATLLSPGGISLSWQVADGRILRLNGPFSFMTGAPRPDPSAPAARPGLIDANGILFDDPDTRRYAVFDSQSCALLYTDVTVTRIAGSVRCEGLAWLDASSVERVHDAGLPLFDLSITFEVTGDGTVPSPSSS
jgi:hypothetical protein